MKKFFQFLTGIAFALLMTHSVYAFTMSPSSQDVTINAGGEFKYDVNVKAQGPEMGKNMTFSIEVGGFSFNEKGDAQVLSGDELKDEQPYSVSKWVTIEGTTSQTTQNENGVNFPITIKAPSDAKPGTYYAAMIVGSAEASEAELQGSGASIVARGVGRLTITIPGEANEKATLGSFKLDEEKYKTGIIEFVADIKNESNYEITPIGLISIYDQNNNQLKGVVIKTQKLADGKEIFVSSEDSIKFNPNFEKIPVSTNKVIVTPWNNPNVPVGKYTAKFEGRFGTKGTFSAETKFEILEGLSLTEFATKNLWNQNLPVEFQSKIKNNGNLAITPSGTLIIKDIWGNTVNSQVVNKINVGSGEEKTIPNLKWENGFALGSYTATLKIIAVDNGPEFTKSITFFVVNWWQLAIMLLILIIVVYLVYKGIKGYISLKKKLKKLEKKD